MQRAQHSLISAALARMPMPAACTGNKVTSSDFRLLSAMEVCCIQALPPCFDAVCQANIYYTELDLAVMQACTVTQGDTVAAEGLTQAMLSALQPKNLVFNTSKGSKQRQRPTQSPLSASSPCHPVGCARAFHMPAKIKAACNSPTATAQIALAGCASSLAERQQSNAHTSTTAPTLSKTIARGSSRVAKSSRAVRGTGKGTSLRGQVADAAHEEESSQGQQGAEGSDSEGILQQAQLLLQAYQLSQGRPMLSRYAQPPGL